MAGNFDPSKYEDVDSRLQRFWSEHPTGAVNTELLSNPNVIDEVVVAATVWFDQPDNMNVRPNGAGLAAEKRGENYKAGANFTHWLENAETSAIGRALANCGYKASKDAPRPSRQEMSTTHRAQQAARPAQEQQAPVTMAEPKQIATIASLRREFGLPDIDLSKMTYPEYVTAAKDLKKMRDDHAER